MKGLSKTVLDTINCQYQKQFGLLCKAILPSGRMEGTKKNNPLGNPGVLVKARADAIREGIRWGETYTFYVAPGVLSWIVPVVDKDQILGGLLGGEVFAEQDASDLLPAINHLVGMGCKKETVHGYVTDLPHWQHERVAEAGDFLLDALYREADLNPIELTRNREHAQQQHQVAENIHKQKGRHRQIYSYDEERALFSLIRIGDKPGARRLLNKMLAGMFLNSPKIVMVQAYAIEMMGYLVRVAIEDSPMQEGLLARHSEWIGRILHANSFETLCWEVREILDDFMNVIFLHGYNRTNRKAQEVLDYLAQEYKNKRSLDEIGNAVGLSSYRVAHLIKETTGKTITQHVRQLRVREAQKLLLHTDKSYVDIAYSLGFSDHSYFIKQFREMTGTTPAKYRAGS